MIPLSPELLAHAYDYLCCCPPFDKLNMPPSDDIIFRVTKSNKHFAQYFIREGKHYIDVSQKYVGSHSMLLATLAHEAIHLHLEEIDACDQHGPNWRKLADEVCKIHSFDRLTF